MPDLAIPYSFVAGQVIAADQQNDNYDEIASAFNDSIASKLADSSTAGRIVVVSNSGAPAYVAMSGDATISDTGVVTVTADASPLSSFQDTQSASISADGVLTGISITPGAGTYLATALAETTTAGTCDAQISLRVNGVNVINGPIASIDTNDTFANLMVMGLITPTAGQAVEVYGTFPGGTSRTIQNGRLVLVRLA